MHGSVISNIRGKLCTVKYFIASHKSSVGMRPKNSLNIMLKIIIMDLKQENRRSRIYKVLK